MGLISRAADGIPQYPRLFTRRLCMSDVHIYLVGPHGGSVTMCNAFKFAHYDFKNAVPGGSR